MKKINILILITLVFIGCKPELEVASLTPDAEKLNESIEKNNQLSLQRNKEYQKFSPAVELFKEDSETMPNIEEHNKFLLASGLPISRNFYEWRNLNSIEESIVKYKGFIESNSNHKYLKFVKQYEAWLLITHYDLLSDNQNQSEVKFLLNELIDAEYKGFPLLYFTIAYLKNNNAITLTEIASIHSKIIGYFKETESGKKLMAPETTTPTGKPLPPEVVQLINKRIMEKSENGIWITKIKDLTIN